MRTIAVATFSRAEYSTCLPLLREIQSDSHLQLRLLVSGTHLSPEFGYTAKEIEADGFAIDERVEMLLSSDTPGGVVTSMGVGTIGLASSFSRCKPDILVLVGDRFELLAAASAALAFRVPVAHVAGGDITEGAVDNQVRYAVSMLSSLHFVAMQAHADRLIQMGEEEWRVFVTGEPALDMIRQMTLLNSAELEERLRVQLRRPVILVTYHPTTLGDLTVEDETSALLEALEGLDGTLIFSSPNADAQGKVIFQRIQSFIRDHVNAYFFANLGQLLYYSLLAEADLMVGNSSSGIWEAPGFKLPVVNIGDRQKGRLRTPNVIDARPQGESIRDAINRGLSPAFRRSLSSLINPYGDGLASQRIVSALKDIDLSSRILQKRFISRNH